MRRIFIALAIIGAVLFFGASDVYAATDDEKHLEDMTLICENEYLKLYLDEQESDVAVLVKKTGDIWFGNPYKAEEDPIATGYYVGNLKSQLSIHYYNDNVQMKEMDNYNDSIAYGQFETEFMKDGVTITYTLGELSSKLILPQVISEQRYLEYYNRMDKNAAKKVKRNYTFVSLEKLKAEEKEEMLTIYPSLERQNIYVLKSGTKDYIKEELMGYFTELGYTAQDMENDSVENGGLAAEQKAWFKIPLTYRLEDENLVVTIDASKIEYNQEYYLVDIDLLRYFGAAGTDEEGYIFVPDGSGALINLNNKKTSTQNYSAQVYGQDVTMSVLNKNVSGLDSDFSVKLPVYGLKCGDKAWFAIIEEGSAYARINGEIAGKTNSYNNVFSGFSYLQYGSISLDDIIGANSFLMYSKPCINENYSVRFAFLSDVNADYSGMANYYRNYLVNRNVLKERVERNSIPFFIEYIGAIDKTKSFLGIKHTATESLTNFHQAFEISEKLVNDGIDNLKVIYSGALNGGLGATAPMKLDVVSKLEKKGMTFKKLLQSLNNLNIPLYPKVDFQYVYKDKMFDGYTPYSYAPRYFDNTIVRTGIPIIANNNIVDQSIQLISPYYLGKVINKYLKSAEKLGIEHIVADGLTNRVFSDYYEKSYQDRAQSAASNAEALQTLSREYNNNVIGVNSCAYAFSSLQSVIHAPTDSNRQMLIDEVVPFYQMVLHGYMEYAGGAFNLSADYRTACLKCIETGSGIYFTWIYEDNSLVKETEYSYLYSVNYKSWYDDAVSFWKRADSILGGLSSKTIVKHEKILDQVYLITYEDGTKITVNYSKQAVNVLGNTIPARDFGLIVAK